MRALTPPFCSLPPKHPAPPSQVRKIGEGTFGEAFKAGRVVLKIVPMEGAVLVNGEAQVGGVGVPGGGGAGAGHGWAGW